MTPLQELADRLRARGYVVLDLRQPIPSNKTPGIVAFCERVAMDHRYNGKPPLGRVFLSEADILAMATGDRDVEMGRKVHEAEASL